MAIDSICNMTQAELVVLIEQIVDRQLTNRLTLKSGTIKTIDDRPDWRSFDAVFDSIAQNIWIPPPDAKSSLESLREDRES